MGWLNLVHARAYLGSKDPLQQAVEFLLGTTARLDDVIVLGMICQLPHGTWQLEEASLKLTYILVSHYLTALPPTPIRLH